MIINQTSTCGDGNEAGGAFTDTPRLRITVSFESLAPGNPTLSTIQCTGPDINGTDPLDLPEGSPRTLGNGTSTLVPGTYTCTVVVDP